MLPRDGESRGKLTALLNEKKIPFENETPSNALLMFYMLVLLVPLALLAFFWFSYRRTRDQMMGGGFLTGFSKSPAKRYEAVAQPVTFQDVAGLEGVKSDLEEIVEYLRNPEKFQRLGGRVPKGVLLNGPPGNRQDVAGSSGGRRSQRPVLFRQRLRVHPDVCRCRSQSSAGLVQDGQGQLAGDHLY